MPVTSGASHGTAALVSLIIGTILSKFIWDLVPSLGQVSLFVIRWFRRITGLDIPVNEQFAGAVIVMVGLSFTWGIIYHMGRH